MRGACDVAVVGAGPYGLAATAHLRSADGLDVRIFGDPMSFWRDHMPAGMWLRSPWEASHISDPGSSLTLDDFEGEAGQAFPRPLPLERFVEYGRWFQSQTLPDLDRRRVEGVAVHNGGFDLSLEDGESLYARRVVVAAGIQPFASRPSEYAELPPELVSHSSDHADLSAFAGREVAVVGAGQSALESAALLHEVGAVVEVLVRAPRINWLVRSSILHRRPFRRLLYAPADIGPAGVSWVVATPGCFRILPLGVQVPLAKRSIRAAGSAWLIPRLENVALHTSTGVVSAREHGGRVELRLSDGTVRTFDHVLLATGYRVDVTRYRFLAPLIASLRTVDGYPELDGKLESSVRGLHFLGAPAARRVGPLARFVAGTEYVARSLARGIVRAERRARRRGSP